MRDTLPMYIPGRLRTASRPSSTEILPASYVTLSAIFSSFQVSEQMFTKVFLFYHKNGNPARWIPITKDSLKRIQQYLHLPLTDTFQIINYALPFFPTNYQLITKTITLNNHNTISCKYRFSKITTGKV